MEFKHYTTTAINIIHVNQLKVIALFPATLIASKPMMTSMYPFAGLISFLATALLASIVAGTAAWRIGLPEAHNLSLAALLFLAQFGAFVLLTGLGVPPPAAQGAALALGVMAVVGT